jgi:hypothetical protein
MKKFLKVLFFIGAALGVAMLVKKLAHRKNDADDFEEEEEEEKSDM